MARIVISALADADTDEILSYLEREAGRATALKYERSFDRLYDRLANFPESGAPRPALGFNIRVGIVPPYIVFYRHVAADDIAAIIRILHGSRQITRKLLSRTQ